ncbi:Hypothetical predicted protein [Pelobates cultripes]|uniref:Uncharacterized protein n=1 Tax=Pelobates cultripes TaxID=61616 RepID=A0AAD1SPU1_PELCU|nr:Hypothetical predicted protein [Pelobates cultripes]
MASRKGQDNKQLMKRERERKNQKHTTSPGQRLASLVIEEWNSICETLTNDGMRTLLEKVNENSRKRMKFIGFVTNHSYQSTHIRLEQPNCRHNAADDNNVHWAEGTLSGQSSESGIDEEIHLGNESFQDAGLRREDSLRQSRKNQGKTLYALFNLVENDASCSKYKEGNLSMKVSRKGTTISSLEADWLELTSSGYQQGLSLVDSIVFWDLMKAACDHDQPPPERNRSIRLTNRCYKGSEIKTDYGPLLHTLAEFGWLLTCVIATPIIRHNSEGNLTTKQIIFLQRPVMTMSTVQSHEKKPTRQVATEEKNYVSSRSIELHSASTNTSEMGQSSDEFCLSSSKPYWAKDGFQQFEGFSGFSSSDSMLRDLDDGQFEQEDGVTQVTCM